MKRKHAWWLYALWAPAATALAVCLYFGIAGYGMYRDALADCPLAQRLAEVRQSAHYTELSELPDIYPKAVLAAEDHRFYEHGAVDPISIGRAVWIDITTFSLREGGSTITQQLAKNLYFTQARRFERKIAEVFMAAALERECEKDEILELYINTIYYGAGYYCVDDTISLQCVLRKTPAASASSAQAFVARFRAKHEKLTLHAAPPLPHKTSFCGVPVVAQAHHTQSMLSPSRLASIDGRFSGKSATAAGEDFFENKAADRRRAGARQGRQHSYRENPTGCGAL